MAQNTIFLYILGEITCMHVNVLIEIQTAVSADINMIKISEISKMDPTNVLVILKCIYPEKFTSTTFSDITHLKYPRSGVDGLSKCV